MRVEESPGTVSPIEQVHRHRSGWEGGAAVTATSSRNVSGSSIALISNGEFW